MKSTITFLLCSLLSLKLITAQIKLELNGNLDFETSYMSDNSSYWYNEIHARTTGFRFDVPELNLFAKLDLNKQWAINGRFQVLRENGRRPGIFKELDRYRYIFPQLNLEWKSSKKPIKLTFGKFLSSYGNFIENPISYNRTFINRPLFYSFYVNTSPFIGSAPGLGDFTNIVVNGSKDWGVLPYYYGGYSTGIKFNYGNEAGLNGSVAIAAGTPNKLNIRNTTISPTLIADLNHQINYAAKLGISLMVGSFMNETEGIKISNLNQYRQVALGIDGTYGYGFWEIKGELNGLYYRSPTTGLLDNEILIFEDPINLYSLSPRIDVKYEFENISGLFTAIRFDALFPLSNKNDWAYAQNWEDNVISLDAALGYKITSYLELRLNGAYQWHYTIPETIERFGIRSLVIFFF